MKKIGIFVLCLLLAGMTACGFSDTADDEPFSAAFTLREPSEPTQVFLDVPIPASAAAASDGFDTDAIEQFFLSSVFGGREQPLSLWKTPIRYALHGSFTQSDIDAAQTIAAHLARVNGFPGIEESLERDANVVLIFADVPAAQIGVSDDGNGNRAAARITIPLDANYDRAVAIRQCMFRMCGMQYRADTTLDTVNAEVYPAAEPTELDWMLMDILYGEMATGMTAAQCREILHRQF